MAVKEAKETQYKDVKAGDLIVSHYPEYTGGGVHSEAVVIGLPTGETHSGGHLGLNSSTIAPGIMCYRKFPGNDSGYFLTLNEEQWNNGVQKDYVPQEQNRELSRKLFESAKSDLTQPVYKGGKLKDLGLSNSVQAEEVLHTLEGILN